MIATFTRSAPSASAARQADKCRVDPAGEPEHDRAEAVLLDVVVQAEQQRLVNLLLARGDRSRSDGRLRLRLVVLRRQRRTGRRRAGPPRTVPRARSSCLRGRAQKSGRRRQARPGRPPWRRTRYMRRSRGHAWRIAARARVPCPRDRATPICSRSGSRPAVASRGGGRSGDPQVLADGHPDARAPAAMSITAPPGARRP